MKVLFKEIFFLPPPPPNHKSVPTALTHTHRCSNLTLQPIYCYLNSILTSKTHQIAPFGSFFQKFPGGACRRTPPYQASGLRPSQIGLASKPCTRDLHGHFSVDLNTANSNTFKHGFII